MNREIKFRAWSIKRKKWMHEWHAVRFDGEVIWLGDVSKEWEDDVEYCILMQYTGLKDKNGKEIYEGDIVKGFFEDRIIIDKVIWWNKGAGWYVGHNTKGHNTNKTTNLTALTALNNIEVIGNIYETPELLRSNK